MILVRTLALSGVVLLAFAQTAFAAKGEAAARRNFERVAALSNREPMAFFLAKGGPNACGSGCSEWIAAEGAIDSDAGRRFRQFLGTLPNGNIPIFFNSRGGLVGVSREIGTLLRLRRMKVRIGRTIPAGCRDAVPVGDACRHVMQSKQEHQARLIVERARCASSCVYAVVGGTDRQIGRGAELGIHSTRLPPGSEHAARPGQTLEDVNNGMKRYLTEMGVDGVLMDAASRTSPDSLHIMSRGEIARYGIETGSIYETSWLIFRGLPERLLLLKSVTYPINDNKEFRTGSVRVGCEPYMPSTRVIYRREVSPSEYALPLRTQIETNDGISDLKTLTLGAGVIEKYVNPNSEQIKKTIAAGKFSVIETVEQPKEQPSTRVVKFSTAGLPMGAVEELIAHCTARMPGNFMKDANARQ